MKRLDGASAVFIFTQCNRAEYLTFFSVAVLCSVTLFWCDGSKMCEIVEDEVSRAFYVAHFWANKAKPDLEYCRPWKSLTWPIIFVCSKQAAKSITAKCIFFVSLLPFLSLWEPFTQLLMLEKIRQKSFMGLFCQIIVFWQVNNVCLGHNDFQQIVLPLLHCMYVDFYSSQQK